MSQRTRLRLYKQALAEINAIMGAMKNLAYIEVTKISRYLDKHFMLIDTFETIKVDILNHFPYLKPNFRVTEPVLTILMGAERGFCGNFNEKLIEYWNQSFESSSQEMHPLIVIGSRLMDCIDQNKNQKIDLFLEGPSTAEEIKEVVTQLLGGLQTLHPDQRALFALGCWQIYYQVYENFSSRPLVFKPFEKTLTQSDDTAFRPLLNLSAKDFLLGYLEQYFYAKLHDIFYQSLMAENQMRLNHLEYAREQLKKKDNSISHRMNQLRQEEIIEEIEGILLGKSVL